jgi:Domain of unknown function (DUF4936)
MWIFVYFHADPAQEAQVRAALERMQTTMRDQLGVKPEVALKLDEPKSRHTWLEWHRLAHAQSPDDYLRVLAHCVIECGLDSLALGPRHSEVFAPLAGGG